MKSKFAEGDHPLFSTREQAVDFLDIMLEHKFFHRAKKVPVTLDELRGKTEKKSESSKTQDKEKEKTETTGGNPIQRLHHRRRKRY